MILSRADLTHRERELTDMCFHEGGHAVAAVVLGGTLGSAVVSGGLRHGTIDGLTTLDVVPPGREPEIAYSGVWSQACWRYGRKPSQRGLYAVLDGTGRCDRALLAGGGTAAATRIVQTLERCWSATCKVAAQLHRQGDIRHDDVAAALGLSVDPETAAIELAHIRAGCAPGSFNVSRPVESVSRSWHLQN